MSVVKYYIVNVNVPATDKGDVHSMKILIIKFSKIPLLFLLLSLNISLSTPF